MAIRIVNTTAIQQGFGDLPEVKIPAGAGQYADISVDDYRLSTDLIDSINLGLVTLNAAVLTDWEKEQIGWGGGAVPTDPNIHTDYTYDGNGNMLTAKAYATAAAPGDPAKLTTMTYDANDNMLTKIVTDTTV